MPRLIEQVGGYLVVWEDRQIEAKASRVHVHQDGHITGMLALTHRNGAGDLRLMPATQFNFSAELTRAKLAKQLEQKYAQLECPWVEMFDYLAESVQSAALAGSPTAEILADVDAEAPALLIDPVIYEGHQNIIFGDKGVNKSTLAYALAIFLALPDQRNALFLRVNSVEPLRTLVLDWETDRKTFEWYLGRLARGLGCGPVPIFYRHCRLPLAQDIDQISEDLDRTGARLLLIDSLGAAASGETGELKGSQAALDFNAALRKLPGISSLIIGQTAKNTETGKKTVYGSTLFSYYARNIFELARSEDGDKDELHLGLFHKECNFAMKSKPMGIKVIYLKNGGITLSPEPLSASEFVAKLKGKGAVLATLRDGAMNYREIAKALGWKPASVQPLLSNLKKEGKIEDIGSGMWKLSKEALLD